jgi:hypothetical protein
LTPLRARRRADQQHGLQRRDWRDDLPINASRETPMTDRPLEFVPLLTSAYADLWERYRPLMAVLERPGSVRPEEFETGADSAFIVLFFFLLEDHRN